MPGSQDQIIALESQEIEAFESREIESFQLAILKFQNQKSDLSFLENLKQTFENKRLEIIKNLKIDMRRKNSIVD